MGSLFKAPQSSQPTYYGTWQGFVNKKDPAYLVTQIHALVHCCLIVTNTYMSK